MIKETFTEIGIFKMVTDFLAKSIIWKYYDYDVSIPNDRQFACEIHIPIMLGGSMVHELITWLRKNGMSCLIWRDDNNHGMKISIWANEKDDDED